MEAKKNSERFFMKNDIILLLANFTVFSSALQPFDLFCFNPGKEHSYRVKLDCVYLRKDLVKTKKITRT
jgi:hypothetical protein